MRHFFFLLLLLTSCGPSERKKTVDTIKEESITRKSDDRHFSLPTPKKNPSPTYPWMMNSPPKITKEFFRCKGNSFNPTYTTEQNGELITIRDCEGCKRHSLPVKNSEEFIYPILITLLNIIQEETKKPVTITSGHRCPQHNTYVEPSNIYSKHMVGAEVSFYVEGEDPERIIQIIQEFYRDTEFSTFRRYEGKTNVSTPPWSNKEVFIKLFKEDEGRNSDNQHNFPYISIQVKYDRALKEPVVYNWKQANRGIYLK